MAGCLDKRTNAWRPDLADKALEGQVAATSFSIPEKASTSASICPLRRGPGLDQPVDKELLRGESVSIFEKKEDWCWVQSLRDKYVGYCKTTALSTEKIDLTHRVNVLRSPVFNAANLKSLILDHLSLNSEVRVIASDGKFSQLSCAGWVYSKHLVAVGEFTHPFLEAAQLFLNSPYIWGGNGHLGVDCSGLVQMAALGAGHIIPRDTDMQEAFFPETVDSLDHLQAGDLLFWPGHVAIYQGNGLALHANATEMMTSVQQLDFLIPHIEQQEGTALRCIKRPYLDLKNPN